jgi:bifunctional pyridoxal-dependent enzyme with beta-cystathionase and maltose regulon repressor activities
MERLHGLAARHGLSLLSDEAHSGFVPGDSFLSRGALDPEEAHRVQLHVRNYGTSGVAHGLRDRAARRDRRGARSLERHSGEVVKITRPRIAAVGVAARRGGRLHLWAGDELSFG